MSEFISRSGLPPFFGSYVLGTSSIRIHDAERTGDELYDKSLPDALVPTNWTADTINNYIKSLLNSLPRKLDSLILVNTGLFNYESVQAAASAVTSGTTVKIIPSLMARFLYITNNIQIPIEENQHVLILTKVSELTDFHVLQRQNSIYNFVYEWQGYPVNVPMLFERYASKYNIEAGGIAVILYDEANKSLKDDIVKKCSHINIIQTLCPSWNEMLLHGGLNKAATLMSQDTKNIYDVKDFTIGFQLNLNTGDEKVVLIKIGASIPITFYDEMMLDNKVKIRSNPTTVYTKAIYKRLMNLHYSELHEKGLYGIQIQVDENGIESISINKKNISESVSKDAKPISNEENPTAMAFEEQKAGSSNNITFNDPKKCTTAISSAHKTKSFNSFENYQSPTSSSHHKNPIFHSLQKIQSNLPPEIAEQQSLILPTPADFMICLNGRHCCICLPSEGNTTTRIPNINGNKWIPMYVSFLYSPPRLGELAVLDMNVDPEYVIYDILNLMFAPFSEIQINPEWAFNVAYTGEENEKNTVIEVQTWRGINAVEPVYILALIIVGLHKEAERVSGKKLNTVFVKCTTNMGKIDETAIQKAVKIGRLECAGVEAMPVLRIQ